MVEQFSDLIGEDHAYFRQQLVILGNILRQEHFHLKSNQSFILNYF